jgi:hypothetical protein
VVCRWGRVNQWYGDGKKGDQWSGVSGEEVQWTSTDVLPGGFVTGIWIDNLICSWTIV